MSLAKQEPDLPRVYEQVLRQMAAYRLLVARVNARLKNYELNVSQFVILGLARERDNLRISDVAKLMRVEGPFITNLAKTLTARKLVKLTTHRQDNRAKILKLTPSGAKLLDEIEIALAKEFKNLEGDLSEDELAAYFATLEKIIMNLS